MRNVISLSLALSVALLGCTMNRTPGNGQPVSATPSMGPAATPGTSSGNVPMSSSYITPSMDRLTADQAAAQLKQKQAARGGRFLGYLSPTPGGIRPQQGQQIVTGQFISPAMQVNPQATVNSSISSQPTPVISSGAGDTTGAVATTGAFVVPGGTTTTTGTTATTSALTVGSTTGTTPTTAATSVTPTTAATSVTPGALALGTLSPTVSSGATASPIAATGTILNNTNSTNGTVVSTGTAATTTTATTTGAGLTAPLVIQPSSATGTPITVSNSGGQIVISNVRIK